MNIERHLEYWPPGASESVPLLVRIGLPTPDPRCDLASIVTIEGFPDEPIFAKTVYGVDAVQTLGWALSLVPILVHSRVERGGRVTWLGDENLHFPTMRAEPRQDWMFRPEDGGEPRKLMIRVSLPERIEEQWTVLVECVEDGSYKSTEKRIAADTWPEALERAAATVPAFLREVADRLGGGELEEVRPSPECPGGGADGGKRDQSTSGPSEQR